MKNMLYMMVMVGILSSCSHAIQKAFITGVSRGIGYELAHNLLTKGIHVIGIARADEHTSTIQHLSAFPYFSYLSVDLATSEGISKVREYVRKEQPVFDFIVHNAAILMPLKNLADMDLAMMENVVQANLIAPMKLSSLLIPYCKKGAKILNVTSSAATTPFAQAGPYCAAKAGLNMLTNILKKELEPHAIAVASVIPGDVDTAMQQILRETDDLQSRATFIRNYNEHKLIDPATCALFLTWLLCEATFDEFNMQEDPFDIYDTSHHAQWLLNGKTIPLSPF